MNRNEIWSSSQDENSYPSFFKNFKYIIVFLGKSGKKILNDAHKFWKFDYEEKKSLTNDDSMIVKISNLQKR